MTSLLDDEYELWAYARRGYRPSDTGNRPGTFADDVADALAVAGAAAEATGELPHLLGGSYGARVALQVARDHAAEIGGLVLFEPPLFAAGPALSPVLDEYRRLTGERRFAAASRLFSERVAQAPAALLDALGVTGVEPGPPDSGQIEAAEADAAGCLHDLEAMTADTTDVTRWSAITNPTLLLQGELTWPPMPRTMDALATALPDGTTRRIVLAGQMHFASHTAPDDFAGAVRGFLRTVGG